MDDDRDPSGCHCLGAACGAVRLYRRGRAGQNELFHLAIAARQGFDVRQTETARGGSTAFTKIEQEAKPGSTVEGCFLQTILKL